MLLATAFLIHILTGISLFLENRKATGGSNRYTVRKSAGGQTWGSRTMPWTGATILAFLILHLLNVRFVDHSVSVADTVVTVLGNPFLSFLYFLGVAALTLHISHGFWSLFQSFGINHPQYNGLIRWGGYLLTALISCIFLGVVALFGCAG